MTAEIPTPLRILTLNVWGIPFPYPLGSKDLGVRMKAIANDLNSGNYDIVALQEVWSVSLFDEIVATVAESLPYSHYFHSGYLGSGVCVLSKHQIVDSLMNRYSLNGFPHHIHRGDWFGGKVVGMVKIQMGHTRLHFYTTHLHAEYDKEDDLFLPHRITQAYELSQFVKMSASGADIAVVVGDLNLEPTDVGLKLICESADLKDSWVEAKSKVSVSGDGCTCDVPSNCYTKPHMNLKWPEGKRIDYVLYRSSDEFDVVIAKCEVTQKKIPGTQIDFTDHQGILVDMNINNSDQQTKPREKEVREDVLCPLLTEGLEQIELGKQRISADRKYFMWKALVLLIFFFLTVDIELRFPSLCLMIVPIRFVATLIIGFCFWHGLIGLTMEERSLQATTQGIKVLQAYPKHE